MKDHSPDCGSSFIHIYLHYKWFLIEEHWPSRPVSWQAGSDVAAHKSRAPHTLFGCTIFSPLRQRRWSTAAPDSSGGGPPLLSSGSRPGGNNHGPKKMSRSAVLSTSLFFRDGVRNKFSSHPSRSPFKPVQHPPPSPPTFLYDCIIPHNHNHVGFALVESSSPSLPPRRSIGCFRPCPSPI